ncbi:hypothetical protein FOA52_006213 [Chlamydomonas sp. UWO 241]|nr:hypothetical protein FOA52_006213 [Chlamydomonas sp. UWO 241]
MDTYDRLWRNGAGLRRLRARSDCLVNAAVQRLLEEGVGDDVLLGDIAALNQAFLYTPSRKVAIKLLSTFKTNPAALLRPLLEEAPHNRLDSLAHVWHSEFPDVATGVQWPGTSYAAALAEALLDDPQVLPGGEAACVLFFRELLATPGLAQAAGTDESWRQVAGSIFNFRMRAKGQSDGGQLATRVSLLQLAPTYEGTNVLAETYQLAIGDAAAMQQPELCASIFELFLHTCAMAASMPFPSSLAEAVMRVQACLDLLDAEPLDLLGAPPSGSASIALSDVAAAAAPVLQGLLFAPSRGPNLEMLRELPSGTRDALVRSLLSTGSHAASLAPLRLLVLDLNPSQREAEQLLSDCHLLSTSPHLLLKMASLPPAGGWPGWGSSLLAALPQVPSEQRAIALAAGGASMLAQLLLQETGVDQPQLLVGFLEEYVASMPSSHGAAAADSSSPGGGGTLVSIPQADWRRLVSGMLDMSKGDEALARAATCVVEMALAASARPQAGGSAKARLVAETRWVVMETMFAPRSRKLCHAAAMGVARKLLVDMQSHLHATASSGPWASAEAEAEAQAEVVCECAGLLAGLGCERSLVADRKEAVAVPARLAEVVLEAVVDLEVWDLGVEPGTAACALVEVAERLPMCAAGGNPRATQTLVLAAYREAAALAASLPVPMRHGDTGAAPQPLHLNARQLYEAAARSAGVAVSGSGADATSVRPRASTVLDLLAACDAAQLPLEAVRLALSVLDGKLSLDISISSDSGSSGSSESSGGGGAEAEPAPPLDEQSVAAEAMAIANSAHFFHGSLTVFRALLLRRGSRGVDSAGTLQMVLAAVNGPLSVSEQGRLSAEVVDAVGEDGFYAISDYGTAAAGGQAGSPVVAGNEWLARMRRHQWRRPSSWAVPAVAESSTAADEHPPDGSASVEDGGSEAGSGVGAERVAYYGGMELKVVDRQLVEWLHPGSAVDWYESDDTGGMAPGQCLCERIRRRVHYTRVYIDTRWSGHGDTQLVMRMCRTWRVPFQLVSPQVKSKLKAETRLQRRE